MNARFWVVGGEYADILFREVKPETRTALGPFGDYVDALDAWTKRTRESTARATVRFTIAREAAA